MRQLTVGEVHVAVFGDVQIECRFFQSVVGWLMWVVCCDLILCGLMHVRTEWSV